MDAMFLRPLCVMLWAILAMASPASNAEGLTPTSETSLDRGDRLREEGKWVQALSAYRSAASLPLTGCDQARIQLGMAAVQWHAGNLSECQPHLSEASFSCNTCPPQLRTDMALELAELMVRCGMTGEALRILQRERDLHPVPSKSNDVEVALLELHFAQGTTHRHPLARHFGSYAGFGGVGATRTRRPSRPHTRGRGASLPETPI